MKRGRRIRVVLTSWFICAVVQYMRVYVRGKRATHTTRIYTKKTRILRSHFFFPALVKKGTSRSHAKTKHGACEFGG